MRVRGCRLALRVMAGAAAVDEGCEAALIVKEERRHQRVGQRHLLATC